MALDESAEFLRLNALRRYAILDTPPEGAFDRITALASEVLGVPIAVVSFVDTARVWFKSVHAPDEVSLAREIDRAPGLCSATIAQDGLYVVEHASSDPRTQEHPLVTGSVGLEFYVGVPLKTHDGHMVGTLSCMDVRPRSVSRSEMRYLEILGAIVMDEIELRRSASQISRLSEALADACNDMERRASFDPLTGVLSRAAILERGAKLVDRANDTTKGTAVLMVDIDRFKAINDVHGHPVGDLVLKDIAGRMAGNCRAGDLLGRIGGEEFLAVFLDVTAEQALAIAERLRETVCQSPVDIAGGMPLSVSVSGGLVVLEPTEEGSSLTETMVRADRALYRAKQAGRNRILLAEDNAD